MSILKSSRCRPGLLKDQQGVTLIELMAGLTVGIIIVAAGFTALTGSNKATQVNDQTAQTQQNARVAMELISRDLKVAGFGMAGPVGTCNTAIVPADNNIAGGDAGPDSLSAVVPNTSTVAPLWTLVNQSTGPFIQITLQPGAATAMANAGLVVGATISIGGVVSANVSGIAGDTLTLGTAIGAPAVFSVGTVIYFLQCVTYQIIRPGDVNVAACGGNAPCLVRGEAPSVVTPRECNVLPNTCVAVAEGIEDLQLAYACDGCNAVVNGGVADRIVDDQDASGTFTEGDFISNNNWSTPPLIPDSIRLVRISLVARQTQADQGFSEGRTAATGFSGPIIVEDHNPSSDAAYNPGTYSQFRRRVITRTVQTRNLGL